MATVMGGSGINEKLNFGGSSLIDNPGDNSESLQSLNNNGDDVQLEPITVRAANYNFTEAAYPDGIGSDMDKQHYIRFFINMRGKSKFLQGSKSKIREDLKSSIVPGELTPRQTQLEAAKSEEAGKIAGAGKVGAITFAAIGLANRSGLGALLGGTGGAVGGGLLSEQATKELGDVFDDIKEDIPRRISDVVTLHIQDRPAVNYSTQYTDDAVGILGGLLGTTDVSQLNNLESITELAKQVGAPAALQLLNTVGGLGGSFGGTLNTRRLLESGIKNTTNPFREQFFERVDFRTFNFRHTFMPKNQNEVASVKNIIELFKFHMHPELVGEKNLMFLYPSEFDIKYYYRTKENPFFNKISTCVLEDMNVEYGGDIFATFENGEPVEVNMTLRFKEIELLTKENITSKGY